MERSILIKAFTDNPIVLRDLRATMRGTRAFWFQGAYLALLGILAVTGYAVSTNQNLFSSFGPALQGTRVVSIVDAQRQLQSFYYFIFITLAGLITLIAPALTATSVSDERQRQSLDLLVTTPLSAAEMLVGKLMSSLAFLGVLLALSLPASALCVLLGGATIGDMFRIYVALAVDAVVLASIGLYFSCACKNSLQSVIWTYVSVIAFTGTTFMCMMLGANSDGPSHIGSVPPFAALAALSPFAAICPFVGQNVAIGMVQIPVWIALLPVAAVTIRLFLTAAAYRLGLFGGESGRSLRKQILGYVGVAAVAFGYSLMQSNGPIFARADTFFTASGYSTITYLVIGGVCAMIPFLPGLFVPVKAEDAPPGETESAQLQRDNGSFRLSAILLPRHAGALPFYLALLGLVFGGVALGVALCPRDAYVEIAGCLGAGFVYAMGAGILMWGVSRLAARWIRSSSSARALAFGLFVLIVMLPALPLSLLPNDQPWGTVPGTVAWLGSPVLDHFYGPAKLPAMIASGLAAAVLGAFIGMVNKPRSL